MNMIEQEPNVVNMLFGSHLYGLNTPNSDIDRKGIYLPTHKELLLGTYAKSYKASTGAKDEKNGAGDLDLEVMSLPRFVDLAVAGETMAIDMLHADLDPSELPDEFGWIWKELVINRHMFYTKNLNAFVGYVKKQAAKYGVKGSRMAAVKDALDVVNSAYALIEAGSFSGHGVIVDDLEGDLPVGEHAKWVVKELKDDKTQKFYEVCGRKFQSTLRLTPFLTTLENLYDSYGARAKQAMDNDGIDWKAISHALRAAYQAEGIFSNQHFSYPLPQTEFLRQVKAGELDFTTIVQPELERIVATVERLSEKSELPEKADRKFWDDWLLKVYEIAFDINV